MLPGWRRGGVALLVVFVRSCLLPAWRKAPVGGVERGARQAQYMVSTWLFSSARCSARSFLHTSRWSAAAETSARMLDAETGEEL